MENSRLYVFKEYLPLSQSENGLMALQKLVVSTVVGCIEQVFRSVFSLPLQTTRVAC
jgi:hypothetical protein